MPGGDETAQSLLLGDIPNIETAPNRFRSLSLAELRTRPKPSYTVDHYLQADSLAVLEGVDGTYKTFLALAWAHSIALGRPWLGRSVQQGRVLYLLGEGSRGLPKRADAWQIVNLGHREDLEGALGFIVDEMPQLWKGDASAVLAANTGPFALIVVDTLARAMVGGNENQQQDMGMLVAGCEELRRDGRMHPRLAPPQRGGQLPRIHGSAWRHQYPSAPRAPGGNSRRDTAGPKTARRRDGTADCTGRAERRARHLR